MAASTGPDGSENVEDFLRRINELGNSRENEEAERDRKLDEDILEARKQREARRTGISSDNPWSQEIVLTYA